VPDRAGFLRYELPPVGRTPDVASPPYAKIRRASFGGTIGSTSRSLPSLTVRRDLIYCTALRQPVAMVSVQRGDTVYPLATEPRRAALAPTPRTSRFIIDASYWPGCVCRARHGPSGCVLWWCGCCAADCAGLLHCPAQLTAGCGQSAHSLTLERFLPQSAANPGASGYSLHGAAAGTPQMRMPLANRFGAGGLPEFDRLIEKNSCRVRSGRASQ